MAGRERPERKRIHFVSDFDVYEPSHDPKLYRCQRCGVEVLGEYACYEHRTGLVSDCLKNRFWDMVRGLV